MEEHVAEKASKSEAEQQVGEGVSVCGRNGQVEKVDEEYWHNRDESCADQGLSQERKRPHETVHLSVHCVPA